MTHIEPSIWDVHTPLPFSTSVLYPLAPLGVGTPLVESLTSYLKRLAHAHHLKVADLVTFCSAQTDAHVLPSTLQKLSRIDGMTDSGQMWSALLRKLTCREEVVCLTMHYWRSLLNPGRMLRQHHAWCPRCYEAALQNGVTLYEPLAWRLQCVEVCPVHQRRLADTCPHCGRRFTTLSNRAVVGFCPKCQHWLGDPASAGENLPPDSPVSRLAHAVGRLLALAPQVAPAHWNRMSQIIETLKQQRQVTYTHLERTLRIAVNTLTAMRSGQCQPNLETFARLAMFSEGLLWEALVRPTAISTRPNLQTPSPLNTPHQQQAYLEHLLTSSGRLPGLSDIARRCDFPTVLALRKAFPVQYERLYQRVRQEQRLLLEETLQRGLPVVLSELAQQHGYHTGDLYFHFYDLCLQITRGFQEDKYIRCRRYLQAILQDERFPTFTAIRKALGVGDYYLKQHFAAELGLIEARRQQHLQHEETTARDYLNRMLASEAHASTSLQQIAEALGKSTKYLKSAFPAESRMILSRRREYLAEQLQATCQRIRQTVFDLHQQGIYPSVDRIHAVIGSWMIHGKAYRRAYVEAMTLCGYLSTSTQ
jgi:AraC-like DNA-binding protein